MDLHKAKLIVDCEGRKFKPDVLTRLEVGDIIRISIVMKSYKKNLFSHDSPYLEILKIYKNKKEILGKILDIERFKNCNKYPLKKGEKIRISYDNIIEIYTEILPKERITVFKKYLLDEYVTVTGPLYTIETEESSEEESSSDSCYSYSS